MGASKGVPRQPKIKGAPKHSYIRVKPRTTAMKYVFAMMKKLRKHG